MSSNKLMFLLLKSRKKTLCIQIFQFADELNIRHGSGYRDSKNADPMRTRILNPDPKPLVGSNRFYEKMCVKKVKFVPF